MPQAARKAAPPSPLTLEWDSVTIADWKRLLAKSAKSNLLLSWLVAITTFETHRKRPHFGVFYQGQTPAALVVVSVKKMLFLERVYIHRGPLWLADPTPEEQTAALRALVAAWPAKPFRRVRILPEMPNTPQSHTILQNAGFTSLGKQGYRSVFLDITPCLSELEAGLKKSWKNGLRSSRKNELTFTRDNTKPGFKLFLRGYRRDKTLKKYPGPSILFLLNLRKRARKDDIVLLEAWHEGELVAGELFVTHGQAATYLVGWTTPKGREVSAHNGLLWDAVARLKKEGIRTLDLGGLTPEAPGLNRFKEGLGGQTYELAGEWKT